MRLFCKDDNIHAHVVHKNALSGLKIMAGRWTMSSVFALLTGQTLDLPVILTGQIRLH